MSSATDPLDTPHSDSDSEHTLTASFFAHGDPSSARSPDATLLADTRLSATPETGDEHELLSDALRRFFPNSFISDLSKHIFSLDTEAMEELAAILQATVAPSNATQSTFLHVYETAEAIKSSLLTRGIARTAIGGGIALILPTEPLSTQQSSLLTRGIARTAIGGGVAPTLPHESSQSVGAYPLPALPAIPRGLSQGQCLPCHHPVSTADFF